jgi:hypothetical protein
MVNDLPELLRMFEADREVTLMPGRTAERPDLPVYPPDPDRHAGPLHRPRQEPHAVDRVMLAPVSDRLARPGRGQDLEGLIQHPRTPSVVEFLAGDRVLAGELVAAEADASVSRPALSRSSVAVSRATFTGRRRASGVTSGPSLRRSVAAAIAANVIWGSAT